MACSAKELNPSSTFDLIPGLAAGRTMVLLQKIPDGCMQALENYRSTKSKAKRLTMRWNGNAGEMKIVTGEEDRDCQLFTFSTLNEMGSRASTAETSKNAEDIVRTSSDRRHQLQAMGAVTCKVKVKAREPEVFQRTRTRIRIAEDERQKVRAQHIEVNEVRKGKGSNGASKAPRSGPTIKSAPSAVPPRKPIPGKELSVPSKFGGHSGSQLGRSKPESSSPSASPGSLAGKTEITGFRNILMYILAPKPLKKQDILIRLAKADKKYSDFRDETRLSSSLSSIASYSNELYHLKSRLYPSIQIASWPHYSANDRTLLQRRLRADDSSEGRSQNGAYNHGSTPSPGNDQQRSPHRSVAGYVHDLGLSNEKSPSQQITPLTLGQVRAARKESIPPPATTSHSAQSRRSQSPQLSDGDAQPPPSQEKVKLSSSSSSSSAPASSSLMRRATLSKSQTNMLAATSKHRHVASKSSSSASRLSTGNNSSSSSTANSSSSSSTNSTAASSGNTSSVALRSNSRTSLVAGADNHTLSASSGAQAAASVSSSSVPAASAAHPPRSASASSSGTATGGSASSSGSHKASLKRPNDSNSGREPQDKRRRLSTPTSSRKSMDFEIDLTENWKTKYSEVTSYSTRCSYKNDFNAVYPLYCQLKSRMDSVMEEFHSLEQLWQKVEGTPEEEEVYQKVISLHDKYMKDNTFKANREGLQFLHDKLSHIKTVINDYDSSLVQQS